MLQITRETIHHGADTLAPFLANNSEPRRAFNFFLSPSLAPDSTILEQTRWVFATQERRGARHTHSRRIDMEVKKSSPAVAKPARQRSCSADLFILSYFRMVGDSKTFPFRTESFAAASSSRRSFPNIEWLSLINHSDYVEIPRD